MRKCLLLVAALGVMGGLAVAAELQSGLAKGEFVPAFFVCDVTGPAKGEELCYRCKYGDRPVVTIFTRVMTPEVTQLAKAIDGVVAKNEDSRMAGFVVVMTEDPDKVKSELTAAAEKAQLTKVPLTTFKGSDGPAAYKINKDAEVTVMMWVDGAVKVSKGFAKAKQLDKAAIDTLVADTKQILD
uniref:Redoxin domain-containing protein n=1 Tax=Schlesneria paludicola TaxID=360056 RepID=A0A7C4LKP0_9PLAN